MATNCNIGTPSLNLLLSPLMARERKLIKQDGTFAGHILVALGIIAVTKYLLAVDLSSS